jgi:hypothetical protein
MVRREILITLGRSLETIAYLARNWKSESVPLQRRVSNELF